MKLKNSFLSLIAFLVLLFFPQGCGLLKYHPASCGYHNRYPYDAPEKMQYFRDFTLYPGPKKQPKKEVALPPGNYCLNDYNCNGPVDAKIEVSEKITGKVIIEQDFSKDKKGNTSFKIERNASYLIHLTSEDWFVHFFLLSDYSSL